MTTRPWGDDAQALIDRLAAVDRARPVYDRDRVEAALAEHMRRLGLEPLPVRWVSDAKAGYLRVYRIARAAWSAAWSAAESAAWSAAWSAARSAAESAAWSAAESAAESAIDPTVRQLQGDSLLLFEAMVAAYQPGGSMPASFVDVLRVTP